MTSHSIGELAGTVLRKSARTAARRRARELEAARPCMGEDEPPVAPQDVAHRLSGVERHDASNMGKDGPTLPGGGKQAGPALSADAPAPSGSGKGKGRSGEAPAEYRESIMHVKEPSPLSRPALHVLSGGKELGTVQRRNGFPRPAVPNSLLLVVNNAHAAMPSASACAFRHG